MSLLLEKNEPTFLSRNPHTTRLDHVKHISSMSFRGGDKLIVTQINKKYMFFNLVCVEILNSPQVSSEESL